MSAQEIINYVFAVLAAWGIAKYLEAIIIIVLVASGIRAFINSFK